MSAKRWRVAALAAAVLFLGGGLLRADDDKGPARERKKEAITSFGVLEAMTPDAARARALDWLKETGKADARQKEFDAIWASDRTVLDKVADTFALASPDAAKLLEDARSADTPAPTEASALLKDTKNPAFFRNNLALAYGRALINRRIYEEGLEALRAARAEQVVDPSAYLFDRAVAEHALLLKEDANRSILRLLDDTVDAPERYRMVAALMHFDMLGWREKDLGWVARMMNNIERRLDLYRGGPKTQDMQKKVVLQLDEMIEELEKQQQQQQQQQSGKNNGNGRPGKNIQASSPQRDSYGGDGSGPGKVDMKKFKELAENWGKLPEKERAKALLDLTRDMPARHRELIENYFKNLAKAETSSK
jgi:hypothetical protein